VWRRRSSGGPFYRRPGRGKGGETASADELAMMVVMAQTATGRLGQAGGGGVKGRLGHSERGHMAPTELVSALMARRWGGRWSAVNAPVKTWARREV
jgi:hypothetical protein